MPTWFFPACSVLALLIGGTVIALLLPLRSRLKELCESAAKKEDVASELASLRQQMNETRASLRELEESRAAYMDRASEMNGINVNSHGQVLRLHRRGESIAAICSALQLPAGEVGLIVKVYEMTKTYPKLESRDMAL